MIRIATVTATGDRYLVQAIDFRADVVRCWGEVTSYKSARAHTREEALDKPASTKHAASKAWKREAVTVSEPVVVTARMAQELLEQSARNTGATVGGMKFRR